MGDAIKERTARLLMDYLEYCARIQETNLHYLSQYRGFRGNRVALVAWMAQELLANNRGGPSWGRVAALVTFAGTLLERPPPGARRRKKTENEDVSRDCRFLVALLCAQLSGRQGWILSFLPMLIAAILGKTAGLGFSLILYSNDLNLLLFKIIVSSKILNSFLPA
ncbi:bcl-2-like protein 10 [Balaenoptera ricei]|uniref:bcl-2-like protein 10 n=1 Tax=Balaenoptera ricei TaxID=2746895 RepID=UPI0028BE8ECE|nr:bcl-2-like protein 10 [Balaenoptera ricei]